MTLKEDATFNCCFQELFHLLNEIKNKNLNVENKIKTNQKIN